MAKFSGKIGYGLSEETAPGVWQDVVVEKEHYGDVLRNTRSVREGEKVNDDLSVGNSISIVANDYASGNFYAMKYVWWRGTPWKIINVTEEYPRLVLRLGGVYHGERPAPEAPDTP